MADIVWRPIADLPDELKDGREVLLWLIGHGATTAAFVTYASGTGPDGRLGDWHGEPGSLNGYVLTHFAEINDPADG